MGSIIRAVLLLAGIVAAPAAQAATELVLQLSGPRQAQFAGYYVAQAMGFYSAAGLSVAIHPGAKDGDSVLPASAGPPPDVWSAWLPTVLAAPGSGALVNVAQIFPHSGLELVCRKVGAIHAPTDLAGRTVAVWQDGAQVPFQAWMRKLSLHIGAPGSGSASKSDVTVLPTGREPAAVAAHRLADRQVACITALNYDGYWAVLDAGLAPSDLQVFHYGDAGVATLQDGLYATAASVADPARSDALVRFLRASVRGWQYAVAHQPEAVGIVLADQPAADGATRLAQTRMMSAVARLTESGLDRMGYLEPAAYDRTVQILQAAMPPALAAAPAPPAWTHAIWRRAKPSVGK